MLLNACLYDSRCQLDMSEWNVRIYLNKYCDKLNIWAELPFDS